VSFASRPPPLGAQRGRQERAASFAQPRAAVRPPRGLQLPSQKGRQQFLLLTAVLPVLCCTPLAGTGAKPASRGRALQPEVCWSSPSPL